MLQDYLDRLKGGTSWLALTAYADGDDDKGAAGEKPEEDDKKAAGDDDKGGDKEKDEDKGGEGNDGDKEPDKPHWAERRLSRMTASIKELERINAEQKAQLEKLAAKPPTKEGEPPKHQGKTEEEIAAEIEKRANEIADKKAEAKAQELANQRSFETRSNEVYEDGTKRFKDFDKSLANFRKAGGLAAAEAEKGFMSAVLETSDPAKVLYDLSQNLDEFERVFELPPLKMAMELDRLSRSKPKRQSEAPEPPKPVGGGGTPAEGLSDALSTDEWMRRRNAEAEKSGRRRLMPGR